MAEVWVNENVDYEHRPATGILENRGDTWLQATFRAAFDSPRGWQSADDLTLDQALAWGRRYSDQVILQLGDRRLPFTAGAETLPGLPAWPPADLQLPLQRRRPWREQWKDRTPEDPPIPWQITVAVQHDWERADTVFQDDGRSTDPLIGQLAAQTSADRWDREPLDAFLSDIEQARQAAGGAEEFGWSSRNTPAWRLHYMITAPNRDTAEQRILDRIGSRPGWEVLIDARPADDWIMERDQEALQAERDLFDQQAAQITPDENTLDLLDAALEAIAAIEPRPELRQLDGYLDRCGIQLGDNHLLTGQTQWLPLLADPQERWLLIELDDDESVHRIHVTRIDRTI